MWWREIKFILKKTPSTCVFINKQHQIVKIIKHSSGGCSNVLEIIIGKSHLPGIVKLLDYHIDQSFTYLLFEAGNNIYSKNLRKICAQLVQTLAILHSFNIIHGDLKPSNLVQLDQQILISDFGSSLIDDAPFKIERYTPQYRAPEVWSSNWGKPADIWALGCTIYELASSKVAFPIKLDPWLVFKQFELEDFPNLDTDFLKKMLCFNPNDRWTAEQLLSHPWIKDLTHPIEKINRLPIYNLSQIPELVYVLNRLIGKESSFSGNYSVLLEIQKDLSKSFDLLKWNYIPG